MTSENNAMVDGEMHLVLLQVLTEIEQEIRDGRCPKEKASLYHQMGAILGLMDAREQQEVAWQKAVELNPRSETFRQSLTSLREQKVSP
ncbi:MAG: hypothetical protein PHC97_00755 [Patescibacteria group bacterium]|nr:hypothetical protein [Patescibacteria group bacterium]